MTNGGSGSGPGDVFDVRKVRRLVELMNDHDLAEIDLRQSDQRIRLRRGADPVVTGMAPMPAAPAPAAAPAAAAAATPPPATEAPEAEAAYITSPMVGTFYTSSSPESPSFVNAGDSVSADTVVCIIEAMKVFNEITADQSGKIAEVLVKTGEPVEFGQKLFRLA
ncbi:MAG: acetyl-CoA carboxylase biotin carboxyl carrier protein [Planctomycetota bacterium]